MTNQELPHNKRINAKKVDQIFIKEFGQEYIDYREKWRKSNKFSIPDFPVHLDIEVVDDCNYRCKFCFRNIDSAITDDINTGVQFDMDLYKRILEEGKENNLRAINFGFSGEPIMNDNLPKMIKMARNYGVIDIRILTNGSLLTKEKIKNLLKAGVTFFSISMDAATAQTYYKIKGVKLFNRVYNNLKLLYTIREKMGLSLPVIRASFYPNPINKKEVSVFMKMVKPYTDFIDIQTFIDINNKGKSASAEYDCDMPFRRLAIFANRKVAPCCAFHSKLLVVGDIKKNTLKEIWNSNAMTAVRNSFINQTPNKICKECLSTLWKENY